jgi:hypothetical protein
MPKAQVELFGHQITLSYDYFLTFFVSFMYHSFKMKSGKRYFVKRWIFPGVVRRILIGVVVDLNLWAEVAFTGRVLYIKIY